MSEGPIKWWRDSWKPARASTPQSTAVHAPMPQAAAGLAYCGRTVSVGMIRAQWGEVTCADCLAARRADQGA